jgi:hypothetical protein
MQFTALNTVAFADTPAPLLAAANTLFSAAFQLSIAFGIALGAIAWQAGGWLAAPDASPAAPFHIAFLVVALFSLVGLWDCLKLSPQAGANVSTAIK